MQPVPKRRRIVVAVVAVLLTATIGGHVAGAWAMSDQVAAELAVIDRPEATTDPMDALGIPFEDVSYSAPLGDTPAWVVPGVRDDAWVVLVHGRGGGREDWLPLIAELHTAGYTAMAISYRNDPGAPADPSGQYGMGLTEGEDLAAAVDYASGRGATSIAIIGVSLGGGAVMSYLRDGADPSVAGVVLDSPMLDFSAAVDAGTARLGFWVPPTVEWLGRLVITWRTGLDWDATDYLEPTDPLAVPALVMHGTSDDLIPIGPSRELAARHPDLVTLVETPTEHADAWAYDPDAYAAAVLGLLDRVM